MSVIQIEHRKSLFKQLTLILADSQTCVMTGLSLKGAFEPCNARKDKHLKHTLSDVFKKHNMSLCLIAICDMASYVSLQPLVAALDIQNGRFGDTDISVLIPQDLQTTFEVIDAELTKLLIDTLASRGILAHACFHMTEQQTRHVKAKCFPSYNAMYSRQQRMSVLSFSFLIRSAATVVFIVGPCIIDAPEHGELLRSLKEVDNQITFVFPYSHYYVREASLVDEICSFDIGSLKCIPIKEIGFVLSVMSESLTVHSLCRNVTSQVMITLLNAYKYYESCSGMKTGLSGELLKRGDLVSKSGLSFETRLCQQKMISHSRDFYTFNVTKLFISHASAEVQTGCLFVGPSLAHESMVVLHDAELHNPEAPRRRPCDLVASHVYESGLLHADGFVLGSCEKTHVAENTVRCLRYGTLEPLLDEMICKGRSQNGWEYRRGPTLESLTEYHSEAGTRSKRKSYLEVIKRVRQSVGEGSQTSQIPCTALVLQSTDSNTLLELWGRLSKT